MRHSVDELIRIAYEYHPRGLWPDDPRYDSSPERERLAAARRRAGANRDGWLTMLDRVRARLPGIEISEWSSQLLSGEFGLSYSGQLALPLGAPEERSHEIEIRVGILVPYYLIYRSLYLFTDPKDFRVSGAPAVSPVPDDRPVRRITGFDFTPEERAAVGVLVQEIEVTFVDHEPMPPEIGGVIVPDVATSSRPLGAATIGHCLIAEDGQGLDPNT